MKITQKGYRQSLSNVYLSFATDPALGYNGIVDKVEGLIKIISNSHCLNQATNPANPEAHFKCTITNNRGKRPSLQSQQLKL